jgi:hypothetical protein
MAVYDLLGRTRQQQQLLAEPLLGEAEGEGSMRAGKFPTFYIDDSACEIAGKKHVILAALSFADEERAINSWLCKKRELGLDAADEVKWNSMSIPIEQRREFVPLLNEGVGIVVVDDSSRQRAAERLCTQIGHYCREQDKAGFRLRFDKDIVENRNRLRGHLRSFGPPCVGLTEHNSEFEQLVQAADFLAGAIKLKVGFGLGIRNPNAKLLVDSEFQGGPKEEWEQGFYFSAALRYCLWGTVRDTGKGMEDTYHPEKSVLGRGLVISSTVPQAFLDKAVRFIDGDFMGCLH